MLRSSNLDVMRYTTVKPALGTWTALDGFVLIKEAGHHIYTGANNSLGMNLAVCSVAIKGSLRH